MFAAAHRHRTATVHTRAAMASARHTRGRNLGGLGRKSTHRFNGALNSIRATCKHLGTVIGDSFIAPIKNTLNPSASATVTLAM